MLTSFARLPLSLARRLAPVAALVVMASPVTAQQLIDRVVARVGNAVILQTDVLVAQGLKLVEPPRDQNPAGSAIDQLIDRQLILQEVARVPPPAPDPAAVAAEVQRERSGAGDRLPALIRETGLDDDRLANMARDTLRIQSYLNQRFGTTGQVSDEEAADYFRSHPDEFMRNGALLPFDEVADLARQRAGAERRRAAIARWVGDLRLRAEIVRLTE